MGGVRCTVRGRDSSFRAQRSERLSVTVVPDAAAGNMDPAYGGFHFSDLPMDNARGNMMSNSDVGPWCGDGFGMRSPGFPHHESLPFHLDSGNPGFNRNEGWQNERGNVFWERPVRPRPNFSGPFGQRDSRMARKNFIKNKKKTYVEIKTIPGLGSAKEKSDTTKAPEQQNKTASQPAKSDATVKKTEAQNGDTKKNVNSPPNKKLKTEETTSTANQTPTDDRPGNDEATTTFSCTLCKFHTEDEIEHQMHINSTQHRDIIKYLYIFLPNQRVDFIQEYLLYLKRKVSRERKRQNLRPVRGYFSGIGQEHFLHRISVAHCLACDVFIKDEPQLLLEHTKSEAHSNKCKITNKDIKSSCMAAAKSLLSDKKVLQLLEKYNKGQDPFTETENGTAQKGVANYEVLVAEEDDDHIVFEDDDDFTNNHDKDPTPDNEEPDKDDSLPSELEATETALPHNYNDFITLDVVGTLYGDDEDEMEEDEEAAEAP
ncbi:A-kinase anchor protein 8-like isoform X2 [Pseudophryne corroboree]|uniref:A-kinase anchor protein 8-like isoform X2 n=1 Tax=Pseudophryne corroboree TaxID=495146 RepID=UPI003081B343